jgi:enoyl-CoA hydratase
MTTSTSPATDQDTDVLVEREGKTLVVTINRPSARNAVNASVAQKVAAALDELETDPELTIGILTGAGGSFSAGMDLKAYLRGESPVVEGRGLAGLTERPPAKPMIAAVEGPALAGGCEMALACDLIVASEEASFGLPETKRGLVAGAGGLIRLPRRIPYAMAMELALTGDAVPAAEAHRCGLVSRLTPAGGALAGARELAARIAKNGPLAVRATKQIIANSSDWTQETMWGRQHEIMMPVFDSEDAQEGPTAFAEKREPVWKGR